MWGMIVGMISGALMSAQGVFNSEVTKHAGIWMTASYVQISAFFVCVFAWLLTGKEGNIAAVLSVSPKYLLLGGAIGAFITYTVVFSINQIGPAKATMFIVATQLLVSYLIELIGLFGVEKQNFELQKLVGVLVMVIGIITFEWE